MKYSRFRWLLAAMTAALFGLVCLQVFWLIGAAESERRKYEDKVRTAMTDAINQIESGEAYSLISEQLFSDSTENHDSLLVFDSVIDDRNQNNIRIIQKIRGTSDTIIENIIPNPPAPPTPPSPPIPPTPPKLIMRKSVVNADDSNHLIMIHRVERLKDAVKGMWHEYVTQVGQEGDTQPEELGRALSVSLRNAGITDTFSFGIYRSPLKQFSFVSDSSQAEILEKDGFHIPLFAVGFQRDADQLYLLMQSGSSQFFFAIWPQLLMGLLLTSLLIFVFWKTYSEALRQKKISEIRNDFINNMTHEFKTPIATISLATDTVVNPAVIHDPEKVRHYAELIRRENKRMNDQVEKVLELALAERNELKLQKEPVDPDQILQKAVLSMSLQATARGGKIIYEENDPLPVFNADPFHLERVFTNLLDNAIKYSANPPMVTVSTHRGTTDFNISFSDHGTGISEEEQKRIFDRFYRISTGNRHDVKGFGLGLSYVKTIVERHGGTISVSSKPGSGSIFTITFPL